MRRCWQPVLDRRGLKPTSLFEIALMGVAAVVILIVGIAVCFLTFYRKVAQGHALIMNTMKKGARGYRHWPYRYPYYPQSGGDGYLVEDDRN